MTLSLFRKTTVRKVLLLVLAGVLSLGACRDSAFPGRVPTIALDSAGVQGVTSDPLNSGTYCTLSEEAVFSVGTIEGDEAYMFNQVRSVAKLSEGAIAVVDGSSHEVRIFDEAGAHLRSMGGRGGPGEFQGPWLLWVLPGDTLWVGDYMPWRLNVFLRMGYSAAR